MGTPIIAVSLNYRLSVFGFLGGQEMARSHNANLGLKDQRLALNWVKANIRAFGGDPFSITIFGESAGAMSVAYHQVAFNGRDDRIFSRAVMQSGSALAFPAKLPQTSQTEANLPHNAVTEVLNLYPDSVSIPPRENHTGTEIPYDYLGSQFFRGAAIFGDLAMTYPKRYTAEQLAAHGTPVWSYRFKCVPWQYPAYIGSTHFAEVAFVFNNVNQTLSDGITSTNPMGGPNRPLYVEFAKMMSRTWIQFFVTGDPNGAVGGSPHWPKYNEKTGAQEIVFDYGPGNTFISRDDYRSEGIRWFIDHNSALGR
ncbi:Cholinesterase [Dactylellina cionopaga]|nr:Cholinesterase [Dactylellina cionopaga]